MDDLNTCRSDATDGGPKKAGLTVASAVFWARLGWAGISPFAPGSVATALVGIPCAWLLTRLPVPAGMAVLALLFFTSCSVADRAAKQLGRKDPGEVVIDEMLGYLVTMVGIPMSLKSICVGFVAFRLFDIWKPWPVRCFDKQLEGGLGIVMDDVAAGCYAHGLLWAVLALWP